MALHSQPPPCKLHSRSHSQLQHASRMKTQLRTSVVTRARGGGGKQQREVVVGIDLGTTNSAIAHIENGKPRCIANSDGARITPSVVSFRSAEDVVVGQAAKRLAARAPDNTFYSVKRLIGRTFDDPVVQDEASRVAYKVGQDEQGRVILECSGVDRGFVYPEEVSAMLLAQLLDDAQAYTGAEVTKAVISVPAYFNTQQREATANAGKLAGLEVVRIIREPVAAALAYGLNLREDQTVLVFDLGGGTYDISLLEVGNGTIEVLSTGGDAHLGGDDWDAAIVKWLTSKHLAVADPPLDPGTDSRLRANLRSLAEAAKMGLTDNEELELRMPVGGPNGGPLELRLSRDKFEQMCEPLWRRARLPLDQACWVAGVDLNALVSEAEEKREALVKRGVPTWKTETMRPDIRPKARAPLSKVLLVGGATRMPAVRSFLANMTGIQPEPHGAVDPDEAVALGAAVQAGILQGQVKDLMVMDQWQASLMRALAKRQLKQDAAARAVMEERFELQDDSDEPSADEEEQELQRQERDILRQLDAEHAAEVGSRSRGGSGVAAAGEVDVAAEGGSEGEGNSSSGGRGGRRAGLGKPRLRQRQRAHKPPGKQKPAGRSVRNEDGQDG